MVTEANEQVVEQFRAACERDARVQAAFLGGSLASGAADAHSDLDLYVVADPDTCAELLARPDEFVATWGQPVFMDVTRDFDGLGFDMIHFVLADGVNGEVAVAHSGNFKQTHGGPHQVLVDKTGILDGVEFAFASGPPASERRAGIDHTLSWFWVRAIGLSKSLARERLWVAHHQLGRMRDDLWQLLAAAQLPAEEAQRCGGALENSVVPLDAEEMARAAAILVETWWVVAPAAAEKLELDVPESLANVAAAKLRFGLA